MKIEKIQIFGERCSGTTYLTNLIVNNFKIEITFEYGFKHWFIKNHYPRCQENRTTDMECLRDLSDNENTLFLVIFRDPYDWLRSLHIHPHQAPEHWGISFSQFLRKKWISYEYDHGDRPLWPKNSKSDPYYYIEDTENVCNLRTMKIEHFLNLKKRVRYFHKINYENLREDQQILQELTKLFRIEMKNKNIKNIKTYMNSEKVFIPKKYDPIMKTDFDFINKNLEWNLEHRIGYKKLKNGLSS